MQKTQADSRLQEPGCLSHWRHSWSSRLRHSWPSWHWRHFASKIFKAWSQTFRSAKCHEWHCQVECFCVVIAHLPVLPALRTCPPRMTWILQRCLGLCLSTVHGHTKRIQKGCTVGDLLSLEEPEDDEESEDHEEADHDDDGHESVEEDFCSACRCVSLCQTIVFADDFGL